jgi:N-acetylneuraminic acid mutarotase
MLRLSPLYLMLGLGALAACAEDQTPTQPGSGPDVQPTTAVAEVLASNTWTTKAAPPDFAFTNQASYGVMPDANGKPVVYQLGGRDDDGGSGASVFEYRISTNTWSLRHNDPRIYSFNTNGVERIGNLLYVSGGDSFSGGSFFIDGTFWAYNPVTDVLTQKPTPPKLTSEGVSGVIGGLLYVLPARCNSDFYPNAGYCETEPFRRLFRYNPSTNKWATKKSAPHVHTLGAGGVINGKFYVAGGSLSNVLDRYDPATDSWTTLAPIPVKGGDGAGVQGAVLQGKLFVGASHYDGTLGKYVYDAFSYDPATNKWTRKAAPKDGHSDIVAITWGGKPFLLALGGMDFAPLVQHPVEIYAP